MKRSITNKKGFTLIELMIVVAVIAILGMIAYPNYEKSVMKSRRADAEGALMGLAQAMERFYTANNTYLGAATGGANTGAPSMYPSQSPIDSSTKFYNLTISAATATSYTLLATPIGAQVSDGKIQLQSTGQKTWDSANNNTYSSSWN